MDLKDYKLDRMEELTLSKVHLYWRYCPGSPGIVSGPPDNWAPPEPDEIDFHLILKAEGLPDLDITEYLTDTEVNSLEDYVRQLYEEEHGI